jgi:hypothetical protein
MASRSRRCRLLSVLRARFSASRARARVRVRSLGGGSQHHPPVCRPQPIFLKSLSENIRWDYKVFGA